MDPTTWITNATAFATGLLVPLGGLIIIAGLILWGIAKPLESPRTGSAGVASMCVGAVLTVAPAIVGALKWLATRFTAGA